MNENPASHENALGIVELHAAGVLNDLIGKFNSQVPRTCARMRADYLAETAIHDNT